MHVMRGLLIRASILLLVTAVDLGAQGFQGAIRGLVRDAGGIVPGAEVILTHEGTNVSRSTVTNQTGDYSFPNLPPGDYTLKLTMQGYKGYVQAGIRVGTQQFITMDIALEVGTLTETVSVSGQSAADRDVDRLHRHRARWADPADPAVARARGVPDRRLGADGHPDRRHPVQSPAGSDQRLAALARRRYPARQQLHAGRRADHRPAQPRQRQPDDRIAGGPEGAGPHLRRGDGPHRRRRLQHHAALRRERAARHRVRADAPDLGPDQQLLQREGRHPQAEQPLLSRRRSHRRADPQEPDVLLVRHRELSRRPDAQRQRHHADDRGAPR